MVCLRRLRSRRVVRQPASWLRSSGLGQTQFGCHVCINGTRCNTLRLRESHSDLMYPAAEPVAHIPPDLLSSQLNRNSWPDCMLPAPSCCDPIWWGTRCAVRTPQRSGPTMELQTSRLILRSFREEHVDAMAELFA